MYVITRRRDPDSALERWLIYCDDVRVGHIGRLTGVPNEAPPWGWSCGFYPGTEPDEDSHGATATFEEARAAFERAWQALAASRALGPAFQAWRDQRDWTARKYAMWARGEKLPSQLPNSMMRCSCGQMFDSHDPDGSYDHRVHLYAAAERAR